MKNSILLFAIGALLALGSCSKEDKKRPKEPESRPDLAVDPTAVALNENTAIPKSLKRTYFPYGYTGVEDDKYSQIYTIDFVYDGNKIKSLTYKNDPDVKIPASRKVFIYTGDRITKVIAYTGSGKDEFKSSTTTFNYNSDNKLQSWYFTNPASNKGAIYTYNSDGTILVVYYDYPDTLPIDETKRTKSKIIPNATYTLDARGNIIKIVNEKDKDGFILECTYTYDEKNNPFKNVLGYNLLLDRADVFVEDFEKSTFNNPTQLIRKSQRDDGPAPINTIFAYETTYDKNNLFLVKSVGKDTSDWYHGGKKTSFEFFYGSTNN